MIHHRRALAVSSAASAAMIVAVAGIAAAGPVGTTPPGSEPPVSIDGPPVSVDLATLPPWQTLEIIDITGEPFLLADYIGTPVLVETFATWCHNCREQLVDTNAAAVEIGEHAAVVALSVETELSAEDVADYAADNEFDAIRFAVMTPELLAAFVDAFGNTVANPPTTPKVVIDASGVAGDLTTGAESVDDLVAQLAEVAAPTPATTPVTTG